jgi:hypothetical protein
VDEEETQLSPVEKSPFEATANDDEEIKRCCSISHHDYELNPAF